MFNYLNLGFDAEVALGFHSMRNSKPLFFQSRVINKGWYLAWTAQAILARKMRPLSEKIQLWVDGKSAEIPPETRTLVVLNFMCYQVME